MIRVKGDYPAIILYNVKMAAVQLCISSVCKIKSNYIQYTKFVSINTETCFICKLYNALMIHLTVMDVWFLEI